METLIHQSEILRDSVPTGFRRYLLDEIPWDDRLICIKGARGVGKTTLLLQHLALHLPDDGTALYISMDDLFFTDEGLLSFAKKFQLIGGKTLLLDEVHKYPGWSREIKLIYDQIPSLKIVITSSSILNIFKGESDLSRRALSYTLKELSLREYIALKGTDLSSFSLEEILTDHKTISKSILKSVSPVKEFVEYSKMGAYPYFDQKDYLQRLLRTIQVAIDIDLNAVEQFDYGMLVKMKQLLYVISGSVPFTPNITSLSKKMGMSRPTLLKGLQVLEKARLLIGLHRNTKGVGLLTKPDKLYLNNPNLMYALNTENVNIGNIRETFFLNQLSDIHKVCMADKADFIVDDKYTFEVGGRKKGIGQITNTSDAFVVKDDIEIGYGNVIPLWLFGFLY